MEQLLMIKDVILFKMHILQKKFNNYLLDDSNIKSLEKIINTNITIKFKNYDLFFFQGISKSFPIDETDDEQNEIK